MNKVFAGLVVVLVAVVAVQFASSATTQSSKSIPARVKALEAKVKGLRASVAALQTRADCLAALGVAQQGNPAAGQGYIYTSDGGMTAVLSTAFNAVAQGQTPTFFTATVNPSCVTGSKRSFERVHLLTHRSSRLPSR